jgi:hypothetical protein
MYNTVAVTRQSHNRYSVTGTPEAFALDGQSMQVYYSIIHFEDYFVKFCSALV